MSRVQIFDEISFEREYQIDKHGQEFDLMNAGNDWIAYITAYAGKGYSTRRAFYADSFRKYMIKVAALAVAAVEAYDENHRRQAVEED